MHQHQPPQQLLLLPRAPHPRTHASPLTCCLLLPCPPPHTATNPSPGPPIHAEVGDTVRVVLRNNLAWPINLMAGGVRAEDPPLLNPGDTFTHK